MSALPESPPSAPPLAMLARVVAALRARRWAALAVAYLRIAIGFAFVPAGLKKLLGQPFTELANSGPFHDFLHAFRDTGGFYRVVGALQLLAAVLLLTQRYAALGAALALPILTAIGAFCWSTAGLPTTTVVTLMWLGTLGLLAWDHARWDGLLSSAGAAAARGPAPAAPAELPELIDRKLWERCGLIVLALYFGATAAAGEIYRPRGLELWRPAFYLLVVLPLVPAVTHWIDHRRRAAASKGA